MNAMKIRTLPISLAINHTYGHLHNFSHFSLVLMPFLKDAEIKAARRRMSTLNDKNGDIGDDIGGLSLDSKDEKVEVSTLVGFVQKLKETMMSLFRKNVESFQCLKLSYSFFFSF